MSAPLAQFRNNVLDLRLVRGAAEQTNERGRRRVDVQVGDGVAIAVERALKGVLPGAFADGRPLLAAPGPVGTLDAAEVDIRRQFDSLSGERILCDVFCFAVHNRGKARQLRRRAHFE